MKTINELLLEAIEKNEFDKFLKGEGHYGIKPNHMVPAYVPTDWTVVIPQGIYKIYNENPNVNIKQLLEDTLISLINGDTFSLYVAVNVIFTHLLRENDKRAPFKLNNKVIMPLLKKNLFTKKDDLKKDFSWMGKDEPEGLWSEIQRIDLVLKRETGEGIL